MKGGKENFASLLTISCLLLTLAISTASARTQAGSTGVSSDDTVSTTVKNAKSKNASPGENNNAGEQSSKQGAQSKTTSARNASDSEIAAAKSAGKVWVNLDSGIYHKGGRWYGKTRNGKFMTEAEAKAAGYKASRRN
jgi:hypothetical protein